jgi:hypothetical protein
MGLFRIVSSVFCVLAMDGFRALPCPFSNAVAQAQAAAAQVLLWHHAHLQRKLLYQHTQFISHGSQ